MGNKSFDPTMWVSEWKSLSHLRLFATPWNSPWNSPGQMLEWVAFSFSRGSSQARIWTQVSHIAGGFFTGWATREAINNIPLKS